MATARGEDWTEARSKQYWKKSVALQAALLAIWFVVGYVLSILLAEPLEDVSFFNFPMSYWIAQNGAIFVFVALIFVYAWRMDSLDHDFDVHEADVGAAVRQRYEARQQRRSGPGRKAAGDQGGEG